MDLINQINHSACRFRKDFYIEVPELAKMTDAEVEDYRAEMDHIKGRQKII
jgi:hypothetical protein